MNYLLTLCFLIMTFLLIMRDCHIPLKSGTRNDVQMDSHLLHHLLTSSPHHPITQSLHHPITPSLQHPINWSLSYLVTSYFRTCLLASPTDQTVRSLHIPTQLPLHAKFCFLYVLFLQSSLLSRNQYVYSMM